MTRQEIINIIRKSNKDIKIIDTELNTKIDKIYKNYIINGFMDIWQRGTSFTGIGYTADRFNTWRSGAMAITYSRDTSVPDDNFNYSLKAHCTTTDASITGSDGASIYYNIEGYDFKSLVDKQITLSFWVKSHKTGIYCISLRNSAPDRSYIVEYTINSVDTWEHKTVTIPMDYSGGTWDYTNGKGLVITWALAAGPTLQSSKDTWLTGNFCSTSNQVNWCDNNTNTFYLTGIQLNEGSIALSFIHRSIAEEIALCQRYYEKSYDIEVAPGTNSLPGRLAMYNSGKGLYGNNSRVPVRFATRKRAVPTVNTYASGGVGNINRVSDPNGTDRTVLYLSEGEMGFELQYTDPTVVDGIFFHYIADAEL